MSARHRSRARWRRPGIAAAALGKYLVTHVLGEGAMGVVYKGVDPRHPARRSRSRRSAHRCSAATRRQLDAARFRNEAQAAGRLSHPNIVAVYEYGERAMSALHRDGVRGGPLALASWRRRAPALPTMS
jgi:serine/threonine protein kinase